MISKYNSNPFLKYIPNFKDLAQSFLGYSNFLSSLYPSLSVYGLVLSNCGNPMNPKKQQIIDIALNEYGIHETPSPNDSNPRVLEYFSASGNSWVKDDTNNAWCSAFACFVAKTAGLPNTGSLLARSWLNAGQPTANPQMGDYAVFWRDDLGGTHGHVSIFIKEDGDNIWVLGGNQSDQVNISAYPKSRLLGYRDVTLPWPKFTFQSNLKKGAQGDDVKKLQTIIGVKADGIFGSNTEEAVKTFQQFHNLKPDGIVGPITRGILNTLV